MQITDFEILEEIKVQEARGLRLEDAMIAAAVTLGMDLDDIKDVWWIHEACGGAG